jgi:hypothetical protein
MFLVSAAKAEESVRPMSSAESTTTLVAIRMETPFGKARRIILYARPTNKLRSLS